MLEILRFRSLTNADGLDEQVFRGYGYIIFLVEVFCKQDMTYAIRQSHGTEFNIASERAYIRVREGTRRDVSPYGLDRRRSPPPRQSVSTVDRQSDRQTDSLCRRRMQHPA
jgi:hypothetical protein